MNNALNTKQAASFLGYSPRTLERYRQHHKGPAYYKSGGNVRYRRNDLERFVQDHKELD